LASTQAGCASKSSISLPVRICGSFFLLRSTLMSCTGDFSAKQQKMLYPDPNYDIIGSSENNRAIRSTEATSGKI